MNFGEGTAKILAVRRESVQENMREMKKEKEKQR